MWNNKPDTTLKRCPKCDHPMHKPHSDSVCINFLRRDRDTEQARAVASEARLSRLLSYIEPLIAEVWDLPKEKEPPPVNDDLELRTVDG